MKTNPSTFTISSVILILTMPCILMLFLRPQKDILYLENRALMKFPTKFSFLMPKQIEEFFNDRLPARHLIVARVKQLTHKIFPFYGSQVIFGKDNFLFYSPWSIDNPLDLYRGTTFFRQYDVMAVVSYFEKMRINAVNNGAKFVIIIPPNKVDIYFDKLPEKRAYKRCQYTFTDRIQSEIKKNHPQLNAIFLESQMLSKKKRINKKLYFYQDTHWNFIGSYYAATVLLKNLGLKLPSIWPNIMNATYDVLPEFNEGDLHKMLGDNFPAIDEKIEIVKNFSHPVYEKKEIEGHNAFETSNPKAYDPRTVLIFRDSFCAAMVPYLSSYFRKVFYYSEPYQPEIVKKHLPQFIIWERISREMRSYKFPEQWAYPSFPEKRF